MILAWRHKELYDVIPYERVVSVDDNCGACDESIFVNLEGKIEVAINGTEHIKDFLDGFETYMEIQEVIALGVTQEEAKPLRTKKETP